MRTRRTTSASGALPGAVSINCILWLSCALTIGLVTLFAASAADAAWYNASWQYRKKLTIDYTKVGATLSSFPVLVSLASDSDLAARARSDGYDILFTGSDGTTKLDHEIEKYTSPTGALVAWVRIPSLSNSVDTDIYMYYGYASATNQQNPTGVWGTNYNAIYHLPNGTTLSANDSTSNARNGTISGATATTGIADGAAGFNGSSYYIRVPSSALPANNNFVVSAWFKTTSTGTIFGDQNSAIGTNPGSWNPALYVQTTTGRLHGGIWSGGDPNLQSSGAVNDGAWHQAVLVVNTTGNSQTLYVDGASVGSAAGTPDGPFAYLYIGTGFSYNWLNTNDGDYYFNGSIDEVRFSSSATLPSSSWISTEYSNQKNPGPGTGAFFKTLGGQETNGGTSAYSFRKPITIDYHNVGASCCVRTSPTSRC